MKVVRLNFVFRKPRKAHRKYRVTLEKKIDAWYLTLAMENRHRVLYGSSNIAKTKNLPWTKQSTLKLPQNVQIEMNFSCQKSGGKKK